MYLLGVIKRDWIFPLLCSFIVVTLFSFTTSWLYEKPLMYDSAVFQLIGKNWAEGRIPYKELWELKGPLAFLPSALGYWFCGSKFGVYVIQVLNMAITLFVVHKIFLLEFSRKTSASTLLTGLSALYLVVLYESGNTVEEYLLPLLSYAFYLLYRYINNSIKVKDYDLPCGYAFTFGCVLGFSLMSRLTNAISICVAVAVIGIILIIHRRWGNLFKSSLWFIGGFLVFTIPFIAYFYSKGALEEMWYGTFLFGFEYAGNSGFDIFSLFGVRHIIFRFANCYMLILVSILILIYNPQRKYAGMMWLAISTITTLVFLQLNAFGHYYIITLPFIPIVFIEIHKLWMSNEKEWSLKIFKMVLSLYIVLGMVGVVKNIEDYIHFFQNYRELEVYERITNKLPTDFKSSFIAYDCDPEFYLYFDISPKYPYYVAQSLLMHYGVSVKTKIQDCFNNGNAKYMVVYGTPELLSDLVNKRYNFLFSEESTKGGGYNIYVLK